MATLKKSLKKQPVSIQLPVATIDRMRELVDPDLPSMADIHRVALRLGLDVIERQRSKSAYAQRLATLQSKPLIDD